MNLIINKQDQNTRNTLTESLLGLTITSKPMKVYNTIKASKAIRAS